MVEITRPYRRTAHLIGPALVKHCNNRRKVADDLGIGIKAVHNYCRGLEIPANNARTVLTDEQIAEALARNGLRRRPTANELHCSERRIDSYCDRNHVPRPPKCKKSVASYNPPIKWNAANVSRVRAMTLTLTRKDKNGYVKPDIDAIAAEFRTTREAIQTVMSRSGLTRIAAKMAASGGHSERNCICCRNPFISEGIHNRQCRSCWERASRDEAA